ncbi:11067_t:CDS:2, partial [Gigaspora margarita]
RLSSLMLWSSTQWITYDPGEDYTLPIVFPDIPVYLHHLTNKPTKILMKYRKHLSPIHMTCLLGHTSGLNPYTTYQFLKANWYFETLFIACSWLKRNNSIYYQYKNFLDIDPLLATNLLLVPLHSARQSNRNSNTNSV